MGIWHTDTDVSLHQSFYTVNMVGSVLLLRSVTSLPNYTASHPRSPVVWILTAVKTSGADWRVDLRIRTQVTKIKLLESDLQITPDILWQDTIWIICRFAFVLLYSGRLVNIMFALAATFSPQHFVTVLSSCRLNIQTVPRHPPSHVISKRLLFKKQRRSHAS